MNKWRRSFWPVVRRLGSIFVGGYRSLYFPPAVIFMAILVATILGWQASKEALSRDLSVAANARVAATERSLRGSLTSYEQILRGSVGLFRGSTEVTAADWKNYLSAFDVHERYNRVQGIGFVKVFPASQLDDVTSYLTAQGYSDFQVWPEEGRRDHYAVVIYLENIASTVEPRLGFDMYSDAARSASMFEARDTGQTTITPPIELRSSDPTQPPTGFNMYTPYYRQTELIGSVADRTASLEGYAFASFRASVFFRDIISEDDASTTGFYVTVNDDQPGRILYESPSFAEVSKREGAVRITRSIPMYGQTWQLHLALDTHALVSEVQLRRPGGVLFFGIFSAVLVSTIVLLLLRARSRDLNAQKERAVELAKDELLSLASHQLRTPATGVKQYVGMVLQGFAGKVPANQKKLLEKAYASNDRQLRIINEILHLAKIDAGRIVLAKQETNLNKLITDIVSEQRPDISASKHTITVKAPKQPVILHADAHMLGMAIENLLSNSIKYTPNGGRIKVQVSKKNGRAYVSVADNGVGIEAGDLSKVFRQFSRLPNQMSQQVGGTGIGLYLARHLVGLHGGSIQVESTPGKGSTFTIILPLRAKPIKNFTVEGKT